MTPEEMVERRRGEAIVMVSWEAVLKTDAGKIVLASLLKRLHHNEVALDPAHQMMQQVAVEVLIEAGLLAKTPGSLPVKYVEMLTMTKLDRPVPTVKPTLLGRLFGRKIH